MSQCKLSIVDCLGILFLAILSLALGWGINLARKSPLPLVYNTPEQRLNVELAKFQTTHPTNAAPISIDKLSLSEVQSLLKLDRAILLDARSPVYYQLGHLPKAWRLSRVQFANDYAALKERLDAAGDQWLILYCSGGDCHDSEWVARALAKLGYSHIAIFQGGYDAWRSARLPIERQK